VANFTAVYDACLLYPASIRDLAVELARTGLLSAKWTARIHAEWINALIRQRPELDRSRLERVAALMNSGVTDCLVTGFESLEAGLTELPDLDDRHVLAAANLLPLCYRMQPNSPELPGLRPEEKPGKSRFYVLRGRRLRSGRTCLLIYWS